MAGYEVERVLAFRNNSTRYGVMHHFRESLCRGLMRRGVEIETMDWAKTDPGELRRWFYRSPADCTLGFNGPPRLPNGKVFAEEVEVPHVAWLVDSAHHFKDFVDFKLHILIAPDQTSCDLLRAWGAERSFFLPHGCTPPAKEPNEERLYPIAFFGSLYDPDEILNQWRRSRPKQLVDFMVETAEKVLNEPDLSYQTELMKNSAFHVDSSLELIQEFDLYMRALDRVRLLRALRGLPVHFFGIVEKEKPVEEILGPLENIVIHPSLDFEETLKAMEQTQIVLNSSPMFKTGGHERIFYAQTRGALAVTNETPWIASHFALDEDLIGFTGKTLHGLKERLKQLLEQPSRIREMAAKGKEKTLKENTWDVRAGQLLEILNKELPEIDY